MKSRKGATRREFFLQGAVAAGTAPAVIGLGGKAFGQVGKEDVRCAMIGTGGRGRSVLRAIVKVPGVRVVALCDINPAALDEAGAIVSAHEPRRYSYHRDMLGKEELDAVLVETPPHLHREHVIEAMEAGFHCSAAKPLALTVNELLDIGETVRRTGKVLHVDQQLRYRPQYVEAMERIHKGEIGEVGFVRAQRYGNWNGKQPSRRQGWLYRIEQSGDGIVENQIHNIDVINWVMNSHPVRASGLGGQNMIFGDGNELLDTYGLTLEYPGNRFAVFSKTSYAVKELSGTFIHAYATKAGADVSYEGAVTFYWRGENAPAPTVIDVPEPDMDHLSMEGFFAAVRSGKQPFANYDVGRDAALTTLLGRKAVYEKRTIDWDQLLKEGAAPLPPKRREIS